jgi:hypothetical protein
MKTNVLNKARSSWKQFALGLAAGAAFLFWTGLLNVNGALITPTATTAQSFYAPDGRSPIRSIDGSGMTPNNPVVETSTCGNGPSNTMWLSNGTAATWITYDLGSVQTISGFHLWNYNENSGNPATFTKRGVQTAGIYAGTSLLADGAAYASAGSAWGTLVQNMTFTAANGLTTYAGEDYTFASPVTTRYLQIYVTSNFGPPADSFTGISEIRFIPAIFPATIATFGTNLAGSSAVISPVVSNAGTINWTVPYGTALAPLAPTFTLSSVTSTCNRTSGVVPSPNFGAGPVTYVVTEGATINTYTVTATEGPPSTARDITAFNANFPGSNSIITSTGPSTGTIEVVVPYGTPAVLVGAIAPTFTTSAGAICDRVSGTRPTPNLSIGGTVNYIVTAQDALSTRNYAVTVRQSNWRYSAWTGDTDAGLTGVQADYTVAVNCAGPALTVNGINFEASTTTGTNFTIGGGVANFTTGNPPGISGASKTLAGTFFFNAPTRTVTLTNLALGATYETSIYAYGFDVSGRTQIFVAGSDSYAADQDALGNGNGIRFSYTFVASSTSQVLTINRAPDGIGTFHMSALANRLVINAEDTDNDGLADTWETEKAGNLTDLTSTGDFDNDGLSDADEYLLRNSYPGLNPKLADTDNDGLSDRLEILPTAPRLTTNPTVADSDGDGLNDLIESNSGVYVNAGNPGTNPNSNDSDGDQYPDVYEIGQGGNPVSITVFPNILPSGIALGVVTDEVSTGINVTDLPNFTHKISGGGAATINGVLLDVLDATTTPANFAWNGNAGGKNQIGLPGANGTWNPTSGNVTGAGNLEMFGTFTYSGGGGSPGSTQQFTLSALEIGRTYELRVFIRKWDNGTVRPQYMKFTNGAEVTNYYILEDRPGTVLGNGNDDSAYYIRYTYVAQSTTMVMESRVSDVSSGNGSFHMYGLTNRSTSPPPALDFNSIVRAANGSSMTLDIKTRPGRIYAVYFSEDLATWIELNDNLPATGTSTIYVDEVGVTYPRTFYRVDDVTVPP